MSGIIPNPGAQRMSAIVESRTHIQGLRRPGEPLKLALPRIARRARMSVRRLRSIWEATTTVIRAEELDALRAARAAEAERALTVEAMDHARALEEHAARLAIVDPEFHGEDIARLRALAARYRSKA